MKKLLRKAKRVADRILGTKSDELFWKFRHLFDRTWPKNYITDISLEHPHRKMILEKISAHAPFENILEVGCASGANLYLLSQQFPRTKLYGIDVSGKAIEEGKKFLQEKGVKNVFLEEGRIDELGKYSDASIDIVFSDAAIIYIGTEKIESVIKEMMRIAKKAVILCEQHTDKKSFYDDKWVHNYRELLYQIVTPEKVSFTKIPSSVWEGDWGRYGYIIEITK